MSRGRKKKYSADEPDVLVQVIDRANMLYHMNNFKVSAVARHFSVSVSVIEPLLFPSRAGWEIWGDEGKPPILPQQFLNGETA